jgi:hypothetical protein
VAGFDVFRHETAAGNRLLGMLNPRECKPLIFRTLPRWGLGFHGCDHPPTRLQLPLAHLRYLYRGGSIVRLRERAAIHAGMQADEQRRGIDGHWANADAEYRKFERRVGDFRDAGTVPAGFEPIDPSPYFTRRLQPASGGESREFYTPDAAASSAANAVVDLTDRFGNLAPPA